jgi:hypothetical protein
MPSGTPTASHTNLPRLVLEKMLLSMQLYPSTEGSFLNCKTVKEFCALARDKCNNKTVLPSLFMVPPTTPYSWRCSTSEPEMRADLVAIGVIKAFNDSASDKVDVPEAILSFLWAPVSQGGQQGLIPLA